VADKKWLATRVMLRVAFTISDIFQHVSIVSMIGLAASAAGYFMFFQWLQHQPYLELGRVVPALLSVICFMYAIYKTVPALEDFWGLKRTKINTSHPLCMYAAIAGWIIFINSFIIAFGFQIESGVRFNVMLENFFGRYGNDTPHYIAIARYWYQNTDCDHRLFIVFFPLYSILIRIVSFVSPSYMFAAYAISNIFAFAAGAMFYKLAMLIIVDPKEARHAVKFLLIFPSAFFLIVPMTESLFLFLSIAVIYYAIKDKYNHVFVFGLLASLTRSAGVLLLIPVACEAIGQILASRKIVVVVADNTASTLEMSRAKQGLLRKDLFKLANLLAFPLGVGIYLLINYMVYGNATQFIIFQREHWGQSMYFFWNTITYLTSNMLAGITDWVMGISMPGVVVFWMSLALIIYGANKIRVSLTLYAMAYFIFAFGPTSLLSGPRYAMVLFPLAIVAAKLASTKKGYNRGLTIAYVVMFIFYFGEFVRDNFVF